MKKELQPVHDDILYVVANRKAHNFLKQYVDPHVRTVVSRAVENPTINSIDRQIVRPMESYSDGFSREVLHDFLLNSLL